MHTCMYTPAGVQSLGKGRSWVSSREEVGKDGLWAQRVLTADWRTFPLPAVLCHRPHLLLGAADSAGSSV